MNQPVVIIRASGFHLECTSQFQQKGFNVRSAMPNSMLADVIVNDTISSAYFFLFENKFDEEERKRVDSFNSTFPHSFFIFIGNEINWDTIYSIQSSTNTCPFLFATDMQQAVNMIVQFSNVLNSDKATTIESFCKKREEACLTEQKVILNLMALPIQPPLKELQATILLDSMGSIENIVRAELATLHSQVPLDKELLEKLYLFFHPVEMVE